MGGNAVRLGALFGGPVLLCALWGRPWTKRLWAIPVLAAVFAPLVMWQWSPAVRDVKKYLEDPAAMQYKARSFRRLLSDLRPAIVHVEEEPGTQPAFVAVNEALKLEIPSVIFSWNSLPRKRGFFEERRYRRTLTEVSGVIGGNRLAENLLAEIRSHGKAA